MAKSRRSRSRGVKGPSDQSSTDAPSAHPQSQKPDTEPPIKSESKSAPFFSRADWVAALIATLISLGAYLYTLAPDVTLEDSGELAVGSMYAGVPHPPGYPMWTIYSWIFTKILPFSNIAWRVAVSSAVAAAISSGLLTLMISRGSAIILESFDQLKDLPSKQIRNLCMAAGISSGLIFAFNGFIWSQAVIVEVYTLGILTFTLTLTFLMRWFFQPNNRLYLYLAYFVFGLCFVNHQTLILAAIGIEIFILLADPKLGRDFLFGNCALYVLGLFLSLKGAGDASTGNPGLFILFNLVGTLLMTLLISMTIKMPKFGLTALTGIAYFCLALIFGLIWNSALDKSQPSVANIVVNLWGFLNLLFLLTLIAYSWTFRKKEEKGLLTNWMALLNSRAVWIAAALLYFYMPIASMTNPPMNWAYPRTVQGFKHSFTRGQYDRIAPSNITRMFIDRNHVSKGSNNQKTHLNGGQLGIFIDEAQQEFSLSYLALAFIPIAFVYRLRLREIKWILGLTGIFISFTLILIYLINPTADELNRHLNKVFFAPTHIFIAGGIGIGLAIIGATLHRTDSFIYILIFLLGLITWEAVESIHILKTTVFAMKHAAAFIGLTLLTILAGTGITARMGLPKHGLTLVVALVFCALPFRPALNNWAENEQRNHLFGYWYGHDMFTPPFDIYPEMKKDAILFGGTDPGRFCPTYMIFCESFTDPKHKNKSDPDFDRRDVYLITQNALADGTYLQYIRAHYNRSTQIDPKFFTELASLINKSTKRFQFSIILFLGFILGVVMIFYAANNFEKSADRHHIMGIGTWGACLILICLAGFPKPLEKISATVDNIFINLGSRTEELRRQNGIYPQKEINTPSSLDNQIAFAGYYTDAKERLIKGQLKPGEEVRLIFNFLCTNQVCRGQQQAVVDRTTASFLTQIETTGLPCTRCSQPMPMPEPQVSVQGTTAVMDINARLARMIFEQNPDHDFYIEESFPLDWMYPHLQPFGIIMKLQREKIVEFEESTFTRDRLFWKNYSERLIGDWITEETEISEICEWAERIYMRHDLTGFNGSHEFIRDNDAQKGFSKLRSAIAGLYTWRALNTKDSNLKQRYNREAHFAYRQAFAFGAINPETVFKFINLLMSMGNHDDAIQLAQTYRRLDPANPSSLIFIRQVLQNREQEFLRQGRYNEAIAITEELIKIDPTGNHLIRADFYRREATSESGILNAFKTNPGDSANFMKAIYVLGRRGRTNELKDAINKFSSTAGDDPKKLTLIKNSYGLISHWKEKEQIDLRLTEIDPKSYAPWFDLAQTRLQLGMTNEALENLVRALSIHKNSDTNTNNLTGTIRTNDLFAPLRDHPKIKPFLESDL